MKNKLIVVGCISGKKAYLNVPREEAIRRYTESEGLAPEESQIEEFEFDDEFNVYDAWA